MKWHEPLADLWKALENMLQSLSGESVLRQAGRALMICMTWFAALWEKLKTQSSSYFRERVGDSMPAWALALMVVAVASLAHLLFLHARRRSQRKQIAMQATQCMLELRDLRDAAYQADIPDEGGNRCAVCMEREAQVKLLPCGHRQLCQSCFMDILLTGINNGNPGLPPCPFCRGTVQNTEVSSRLISEPLQT